MEHPTAFETISYSTSLGELVGRRTVSGLAFLGVPYARAERFCYAEPVEHWDGTLNATTFGAACPQNRGWHPHLENPERLFYYKEFRDGIEFHYDETTCLNCNIYTPVHAEKCPVVIFIHGGGFDSGMNCEDPFDGSALAERGVVSVFINYRVGVLGYLTHEAIQKQFGRDGNFGLDDQLTAIRWVKAHIREFGGDPDNITLMGQSAGAISIQYLCLHPQNKDLFRRAVMLSGGGLFPQFALPRRAEDTHAYWLRFMELAGCKTFDELKAASCDTLFDAVEAIKAERKDNTYHNMPVIDGCLLPAPVDELIRTPLPLGYWIGYTNTDMYAPIMAYIGDRFAKQNGGYVYCFDIDAPGDDNRAFHSSDLRYMLGTLSTSWRPYDEHDRAASETMLSYLCNFARTGNPNSAGLPTWEPAKRGIGTRVLRICRDGVRMGRPPYGKLVRNFLQKGAPKA